MAPQLTPRAVVSGSRIFIAVARCRDCKRVGFLTPRISHSLNGNIAIILESINQEDTDGKEKRK